MSKTLDILQIAPRIPWPVTDGSAIGIYHITRAVAARGHRVTFVAYAERDAPEHAAGDMASFCDLEIVVHDTRNSPARVLRNLFSDLPYPISKYQSAAMFARLDALCARRHFDVMHVDHAQMAAYGRYLHKKYGIPYVLREHNFETTIYRRHAERARLLPLRWYFGLQAARLLRYETREVAVPDVVAAITREDAAEIARARGAGEDGNEARIMVIPAGVDCAAVRPSSAEPDPAHVVIVGPLVWAPNADAATWFADEIWPRIAAAEPAARCTVAGLGPPRRLRARETARLRFPGFVDDYETLLRSATVMAVPLRIGGGMRVKLLEFFARGKAVVSTGIGAEGNAARADREYLRADTAAGFAEAVLLLLRDEARRRALGAAARALVEREYDWTRIGAQFEMAYLAAIA